MDKLYSKLLKASKKTTRYDLNQGSQTRGPPDVFVWPTTSLKLLKLLLKLRFLQYKSSFSLQLWPAETFFLFMRPASPFYVKMWPAYETEFETPDLNQTKQ
jgi:hypothetical protein